MKVRIVVGPLAVLVRKFARHYGPTDVEFGVIEANPTFGVQCISGAHEVEGLGIRLECQEPMSESLRYIHHGSVFSGQLGTKGLTKTLRLGTQIENHVIKRTTNAAHDFHFRRRRKL